LRRARFHGGFRKKKKIIMKGKKENSIRGTTTGHWKNIKG